MTSICGVTLFSILFAKIDLLVAQEFRHMPEYALFILTACIFFPLSLISTIIFFVSSVLKSNYSTRYFLTSLVAPILLVISFILLAQSFEKTRASVTFEGVVISFLEFTVPCVWISLNPKRLRQITLFALVFIGLALSSFVLEKIFPTLVNISH